MTIDSTRHILYALIESANKNKRLRIDIYDLGYQDNEFKKVGSVMQADIIKMVEKSDYRSNSFELKS